MIRQQVNVLNLLSGGRGRSCVRSNGATVCPESTNSSSLSAEPCRGQACPLRFVCCNYISLSPGRLLSSDTHTPSSSSSSSATPAGGALSPGLPALPPAGGALRRGGSAVSRAPTAGGERWAASTASWRAGDRPSCGCATSSHVAAGPRPSGGR